MNHDDSRNVPAGGHAREAGPAVVETQPTSETPTERDPDVCTRCATFGRPGRLALATAVCDTCGYDPHGYYDDDLAWVEPIEASR